MVVSILFGGAWYYAGRAEAREMYGGGEWETWDLWEGWEKKRTIYRGTGGPPRQDFERNRNGEFFVCYDQTGCVLTL
jgi:hypothetical protein